VKVVVTKSQSVLIIHGPLSISLGRSQAMKGTVFISPQLGPLDAEIVCEFETPIGRKFQKRDRWNLSYHKERGHETREIFAGRRSRGQLKRSFTTSSILWLCGPDVALGRGCTTKTQPK
jgi:hypothetical protein